MDHPGGAQFRPVHSREPRPATSEGGRVHPHDAACNPCITIGVVNVEIVDDHRIAKTESAAESGTPPAMERLEWSERHPADTRKAESKPYAAAKAEEADQCRTPVARPDDRPGPPRPSPMRTIPAAIVIRRPAPWIGANPGPSVIVTPNPPAILIRRPVLVHLRHPDLAVLRVVLPLPVLV